MSIKAEDTAASSATSTNAPKFSKFATKPGFVIPRNKISGSLVPKFSGGKKPGSADVANEESTKQVQRKTKWGPDLTQDAAVRKGRALAYQTRVDQIAELLRLGSLEAQDSQDSLSMTTQSLDHESFSHQNNSEELKAMELERREAIGEIIKLNPSYKAPRDYKPLLKEAKVPIPIKDYPGYNFIGLIFGSANDTQKHLEKETGAKIQVYGTKADTKEKGEITNSDGNEISGAYEELYVRVSADTYEKVDAAVALVELLVTPVSANTPAAPTISASVSSDSLNIVHPSQFTSAPYTIPSIGVNPGVTQPAMGSTQTPGQNPFPPYPGPWFPPRTLISPPPGFIPPPNPYDNQVQLSSSPIRPLNMPSLFGHPPAMSPGFGSVPQHHSLGASRPMQTALQRPFPLGHTGPPRNHLSPTFQPSPAQPYISVHPQFTANQANPAGPSPNLRPLILSPHPPLQSHRPQLDRPMIPGGNNTIQWSQPLAGATVPPMAPPQVPHSVASLPMAPSGAPPRNTSAINMFSPVTFSPRPSIPESSSAAVQGPVPPPSFTSVPQPQLEVSPVSSSYLPAPVVPPIQSSHITTMQSGMVHGRPNASSQSPGSGSVSILSPVAPTSSLPPPQSGLASFSPMKPPVTALKPPSAGDFTFQPHRPQNPTPQSIPRPNSQPPMAPQTPSFRPAMQGFPRPPVNNQVNQPHQTQSFLPFAPNPNAAFSNHVPVAPPQLPHNGSRNFTPTPQMANFGGHFPPRPGNSLQLQQQQTHPPRVQMRPQTVMAPPNQQHPSSVYGKQAPNPSGTQQIYDPFSPTSVPPSQGGNNSAAAGANKQDNDPEYEDLMASVGVK